MKMRLIKPIIRSCGCITIILMTACSSHIPPEIKQSLEGSPSVAQVHQSADGYLSKKVRWGGVILSIENKPDTSWITILASPLNDLGKPQNSDKSHGRFIAIVDQFLEPLLYSKDRKITIIGNILRTETVNIGEFPYEHPVVQVKQLYLWPVDPAVSDFDRHPYLWHDPWYDPWYYPYYPWHSPYYPRHYYP